ncbi:hypothetical protein H310_13897 [Aphanomyces invadans]|uniref:Uncharacterized protein n=1 Tax=Aphanomyces invadans TaxID=157072 RepID=A0A024TDI2_9STRA|nr:hypothetical protein H310_13897 [Aphanomyces invadans]ETV91651.1 hypothetical protein H310_13897 [Aphanomyces invadans]|eukprot:XP_008879770.1 hypothetical protein H310_13897 [Aphanomyces invadans]
MRLHVRDSSRGKPRRCLLCQVKEKVPSCGCDSFICRKCMSLWKTDAKRNPLRCDCKGIQRTPVQSFIEQTEALSLVPTKTAPLYMPQPMVAWKTIEFGPLERRPTRGRNTLQESSGAAALFQWFAIKETASA